VISIYDTNLSFGDRIRIAAFAVSVPNSRRTELNLAETPYLKSTKLVDGQDGYIIEKEIPLSILSIFANPILIGAEYRVVITNDSGNPFLAESVGKVVETLGVKVSSVRKGEGDSVGCTVRGSDPSAVEIISKIFDCSSDVSDDDNNIDLEIVLGNDFEELY
jgi:hypothetical protein